MVDVVLFLLLGIAFGVVTGLTPGVHINLVSALLISVSGFLLLKVSVVAICVFIVAMSVTHTFLDTIPSIFLGAPDSATALGVLPGHRYLLKGRGYTAVKLTVIGSFGALLLSTALFPLFVLVVRVVYPLLKDYIGYLLVLVVCFMIFRDRKRVVALFVFLLSGLLGLVVLNLHKLDNSLFPLLSGLFGVSTLLYSLSKQESIPEQKKRQSLKVDKVKAVKALLSGQFSGFLTAMFPGVGSAQAAVISLQFTRNLGDYGFMILIGSINTVNFLLSFATLLVLDKARNGSVIAISKLADINPGLVFVFLASALVAGSISVFLCLRIAKLFTSFVSKVSYKKLVLSVVALIVVFATLLSGFIGLLVLLCSTAVGLIPAVTKVSRTHAMGCLLLPITLFFLL